MKEIQLSKGKVAIVDDVDFDSLNRVKWHATFISGTFYAQRKSKLLDGSRRTILMHRIIMGNPPNLDVDHFDRNGLNNQRGNLRIGTNSQNQANTGLSTRNNMG